MYLHDDYCPDKAILQQLNDRALWQSMVGRFNWWDGWWSSQPRNIWEQIIQNIWASQGVENSIAGFEYWCNILDADTDTNHLGWHRDKDEALKASSGEIQCPMAGTVFYGYPHDIDGGYLEIACDDSFTDTERIRPLYNRVVIFDVSQFHRVTRIYRGQRFGLQINLWRSKPQTFADGDQASVSY